MRQELISVAPGHLLQDFDDVKIDKQAEFHPEDLIGKLFPEIIQFNPMSGIGVIYLLG